MKRLFQVALVSLLVSQFFLSRFENMAFAGDTVNTVDTKIDICHASNAHTNPYTFPNVNISSIINLPNGHDTHNGPVWFAGIADHSWGDIIPSFDWYGCPLDDDAYISDDDSKLCSRRIDHVLKYADEEMQHYDGKNWVGSEEGQSFWNNDCQIPGEEPTPTPTDDPEDPTPTPTDDPEDPTPTPTDDPEEPTPTPTDNPEDPTPTPTDDPEDPTPTPTDSPNNDPEPTPTDAPGTGGVILEPTPIVRGQVLGVSTMANTGITEDLMALGSITSGIVLLASQYVQKKRS